MAIVGLGLMGGSLAMALKEHALCREVVGIVRRPAAVHEATSQSIVHRATVDLAEGISGADVVILATPVRTILRQLRQLAELLLHPVVVMDLGSTKAEIVQAMEELPPQVQPIGAHPMCGKETAGLSAAEVTLYVGAPWVLIPLRRTSASALALARELAESVGARPIVMGANRHDRLVAAVSHLPYALAVTLMLTASGLGAEDELVWQLAASGFRDTSRVAASEVTMMLDILITNQAAVGDALQQASAHLRHIADLLTRGDEEGLRALLQFARDQRAPMFQPGE